jgi:rubredoxin
MAYFKCDNCGNTLEATTPPEICPACSQKCSFVDVTCYTPECGGPDSQNINPTMLKKENATDKTQG